MRTLPELVDVSSDQQVKGLEVTLVIDRDTASRLGITAAMIDNTLYDAFGQRQVSIIYTLLNQYRVVMVVDPRFWQTPDTLKEIYIKSTNGAMVPLSTFTKFERTATSLAVAHQGQFPSVTVSFNLAPKVPLGNAVAAVERAQRDMGFPSSIRSNFSGTAQAFKDSVANQPFLILAALVTMFIVLGMLYESYIHPLTFLIHSAFSWSGGVARATHLSYGTESHWPDWPLFAHRSREEERYHDGGLCSGSRAQGRKGA